MARYHCGLSTMFAWTCSPSPFLLVILLFFYLVFIFDFLCGFDLFWFFGFVLGLLDFGGPKSKNETVEIEFVFKKNWESEGGSSKAS